MVFDVRRKDTGPKIPVGTQWILDTVGSGTWEVPATGEYEIEMHGAGGNATIRPIHYMDYYISGGGSGELYTTMLEAGEVIDYVVGRQGNVSQRRVTKFKNFSLNGGQDPIGDSGGRGIGSLATDGTSGTTYPQYGGLGNKNKPDQTYGNGGSILRMSNISPAQNGAIIITYLG